MILPFSGSEPGRYQVHTRSGGFLSDIASFFFYLKILFSFYIPTPFPLLPLPLPHFTPHPLLRADKASLAESTKSSQTFHSQWLENLRSQVNTGFLRPGRGQGQTEKEKQQPEGRGQRERQRKGKQLGHPWMVSCEYKNRASFKGGSQTGL